MNLHWQAVSPKAPPNVTAWQSFESAGDRWGTIPSAIFLRIGSGLVHRSIPARYLNRCSRNHCSQEEINLERWSFRNVDCVHPPMAEKSHAKEIPDRGRHNTVRFVCARAVADHEERSRPTDAESAGNRQAVYRSGRFGIYTGPQDAGCQEDWTEIYRTGCL